MRSRSDLGGQAGRRLDKAVLHGGGGVHRPPNKASTFF